MKIKTTNFNFKRINTSCEKKSSIFLSRRAFSLSGMFSSY